MRWKVLALFGAAAGGFVWAAHRRVREENAERARWASATDRVTPA